MLYSLGSMENNCLSIRFCGVKFITYKRLPRSAWFEAREFGSGPMIGVLVRVEGIDSLEVTGLGLSSASDLATFREVPGLRLRKRRPATWKQS